MRNRRFFISKPLQVTVAAALAFQLLIACGGQRGAVSTSMGKKTASDQNIGAPAATPPSTEISSPESSPATGPTTELSAGGGIDSGGGDPLAVQFIQILNFLRVVNEATPIKGLEEVENVLLSKSILEIEESLEGQNPIVIFPEGETIDCLGEPKLGCFADDRISFARDGWIKADLATKIQVASMEIFLFMGLKERYEKAAVVSAALAPRLLLYNGNIQFPKSTDRAKETALLQLNDPKAPIRHQVLAARDEACVQGGSPDCQKWAEGNNYEEPEKSTFKFTEDDIISVTFLGEGTSLIPTEESEDDIVSETTYRRFIVIVRGRFVSRIADEPTGLVVQVEYQRNMSYANGEITNDIKLASFYNSLPQVY